MNAATMIAKRHPFSIDYITSAPTHDGGHVGSSPQFAGDERTGHLDFVSYKNSVTESRQTPSPTDSGLESDHSPAKPPVQAAGNHAYDIVDAILSLEKTATTAIVPRTESGPQIDDNSKNSNNIGITTNHSGSNNRDQGNNSNNNAAVKPPHSYIALISMAILSSKYRKMLLCDIYKYIMETFDYYNNEERAWRNSIRHNLSLNECFVKAGRSDSGKGNYWAIHPACENNFSKGDFRRRQARRRARKSSPGTSSQPSYGMSTGYVPMTMSHVAYHPYGARDSAPSSSEYSQSPSLPDSLPSSSVRPSSVGAFPMPMALYRSNSMQSTSSQSSDGSPFFRSNVSACGSQSISPRAISVAAQQFWAQQSNNTIQTMQALAHQQLASSFQYQNWPQ